MASIKPAHPDVDLRRGVDYTGITCTFLCHDGKGNIVLHKRSKNCRDEQGRWDPGGGALEFGEDFVDAIKREVREEYCAEAKRISFIGTHNVVRDNNGTKTHWVAIVFHVLVDPAEVKIGEPDKMDDLLWATLDTLPEPMHSQFGYHQNILKEKGLQ